MNGKESLKFMQVHNLYPKYYEHFYGSEQSLCQSSYPVQNQALIDDGFAAIHLFAPYMGELGYQSCLVYANCRQAQFMWARENGLEFCEEDWQFAIVRAQIEAFDPDVLYLSEPIELDSRFVRTLHRRPKMVLGWRASDIPAETDWSEFDIIFSALPGLLEVAKELGARSTALFSPGVPRRFPETFAALERTRDLVFAGTMNEQQFAWRNCLLQALAGHGVQKGYAMDLHLLLQKGLELSEHVEYFMRPPAFGTELYKVLGRAKIGFDARAHMQVQGGDSALAQRYKDFAANHTANMRLFETTSCGAMLLTQEFANLGEFFDVGKEVVAYSSKAELLEAVDYYLNHDQERREIAERGRERCLRDHSMEMKTRRLDEIIRNRLALL